MNSHKKNPISLLLICATAVLISGCAGLMTPKNTIHDEKAAMLAAQIKSINQNLHTFKGTARVTIVDGSKSQRMTIAWAAMLPDKIRLTILNSGIPVETILADGSRVIFVSHTGKHSLHEINSPNPSLERIVSMPVRIQEIISILAGQVPMEPFNRQALSDKKNSSETTLVLAKKWGGTVGMVQFDKEEHISRFQRLNREKETLYSVERLNLKTYKTYTIPSTTIINDGSGRTMTLKITGFYPDIPVKESLFSLTEIK